MENKLIVFVAALSLLVALSESAKSHIACFPGAEDKYLSRKTLGVFVGAVVKCRCTAYAGGLETAEWKVAGIKQSSGFSAPNHAEYTRTIIAADNDKVISCVTINNAGVAEDEPGIVTIKVKARMPKDEQSETLSTAGLAVAVTCLVIIIVLIVLIVIIFRRIDQNATRGEGTGNDTHLPMSNLGFERDHQPRKTPTPVVGKSSEFKTWLLSKQISEDTYEVIQREGFDDPAIFAFLKPEAVSRLAIRPMAQELILTDIVESFNKGETPFQTCGTAGDELYDDVTNEKYEHLRVA